jgi:hypothetical protein
MGIDADVWLDVAGPHPVLPVAARGRSIRRAWCGRMGGRPGALAAGARDAAEARDGCPGSTGFW